MKILLLSQGQFEALKLACTDLNNHEIAKELGCSKRTVDGYMAQLYQKLGCKNRYGLIIHAYENGLIEDFKNK